ncbi:CD209 antigen-like protein E [Xiphophorus couchianus]|uniref:CD209 antigen-like protein E n=1 Tax=Xiphophorus couchianus TaxID=32473 RepID=UPI001016D37E|nr:CD209 antigen-like protein E [Xiphophorus couchianus]
MTKERDQLNRIKVNLTDSLQSSNVQLSALTKEKNSLNAKLTELSNEVTRLQSLSNKICPAGWRMFSCSCYFLSTTSGSWNKAREDCRNRGGDLVVISDDDEQKFVVALTETSAWIGLRKETEGSWKWVDGTALSSELKKFWGEEQPDNSGGKEDCVQIWGNSKTWNDDKCDAKIKWICEKAPM